jgi:hypothetical protein
LQAFQKDSYSSQMTQELYDAHVNCYTTNSVAYLRNLDENIDNSTDNVESDMNMSDIKASLYDRGDYKYNYHQLREGYEEDDDDLFKAISSADAIDFDPSYTANNVHTPITPIPSTVINLSPLSRRIGSRKKNLHNSNNEDNISSYGSSLFNNEIDTSPLNTDGFLSGISFDFFSNLLQSSIEEISENPNFSSEDPSRNLQDLTSPQLNYPQSHFRLGMYKEYAYGFINIKIRHICIYVYIHVYIKTYCN